MKNIKVEKISEKENPILRRKEMQIKIIHPKSATPTKASLQSLLANELKKDAGHIDIRNVFSDHGRAESLAKIFVWEEKKSEDLSKKKEEKKEEKKPEGEEKKEESKKE